MEDAKFRSSVFVYLRFPTLWCHSVPCCAIWPLEWCKLFTSFGPNLVAIGSNAIFYDFFDHRATLFLQGLSEMSFK